MGLRRRRYSGRVRSRLRATTSRAGTVGSGAVFRQPPDASTRATAVQKSVSAVSHGQGRRESKDRMRVSSRWMWVLRPVAPVVSVVT